MTSAVAHDALDAAYRNDARRVLATLVRLLGSFDAAEEALHDAFLAAAEQWPTAGVPVNPYAWLVSAGRFKTIDRWRRQERLSQALPEFAATLGPTPEPSRPELIQDDELRLIFICSHPALAPDARVALTLREVGGLTTEEIARAFLSPTPTIAQRIVRAKARIRDDAIPYEVPARAELPDRIDTVLHVIYLIFNEGYSATDGPTLTRVDLCTEAIRLGRLLLALIDEPEVRGLLALMLLHDARRATRVDVAGDLVLLDDQDRSRWDRARITEAERLIEQAFAARRIGTYVLQAAIVAAHAAAASVEQTDWGRIVALYDMLTLADPSPVVALNRAAALGMRDGPAAGLAAIDAAMSDGSLDRYHLSHAARADMQRRLGLTDAARSSYQRARAGASASRAAISHGPPESAGSGNGIMKYSPFNQGEFDTADGGILQDFVRNEGEVGIVHSDLSHQSNQMLPPIHLVRAPVAAVAVEIARPTRPLAPCSVPIAAKPVRDLEPLSLRYRGTFVVSGATTTVTSTLTVTPHPDGGWAVVERAVLPRGIAVDSARLDARTLAPRERAIQQGPLRIALVLTDTLATGTVTTGGETRTIAAQLCGTLLGDGAGAFLVVGRLPLSLDYRTTLRHLDVRGARESLRQLAVVGSERVTVPAGTFETWTVEQREEGSPSPTIIWIDKRSLVPVKFSSSQGPVTVSQALVQ